MGLLVRTRIARTAAKKLSGYRDQPLDSLLAVRSGLVESIAEIDAELDRRGVRAIYKTVGAPRWAFSAILAALQDGPLTPKAVAQETGQSEPAVYQMLSKMALEGAIVRVRRGVYGLKGVR